MLVTYKKEELPNDIEQLKDIIAELSFKLTEYTNRVYGKSSEKFHSLEKPLFDEAEMADSIEKSSEELDAAPAEPETIEVPAHTRLKPKRKPLPDNLPRIDITHDLTDSEKTCGKPGCNCELKRIGEEVSEQLDVVPAKMQVIRHTRYKYVCPNCSGSFKTAALPPQPIPKSLASPGLLAHVAVSKYQDALPLYRQEKILLRSGVDLARSTLASWMIEVGERLLTPILNLLLDEVFLSPVLCIDETPIRVLKRGGKIHPGRGYMWVLVRSGAKPVRIFEFDPSRGARVPKRLIPEDYSGTIMADGYEAYNAVCGRAGIKRAGCWAHARRKFADVLKSSPKTASPSLAKEALEIIGKLYEIERECKEISDENRFAARQEKAKPIIDTLREWLTVSIPRVPPKSPTGRAFSYLHKQWPRLISYLDDGAIPIDNNLAENSIRPFAIGRKNWLFSDTEAGARGSAAIYSMIETAKANGHEPYEYLKHLFSELPKATCLEDYDKLLPWNFKSGTIH